MTEQTQHINADQLENYGLDEFKKWENLFSSTLEERLSEAGRMVETIEKKTPGLKNLLNSKGIGDNALVASMLIGHAAIYHIRQGPLGGLRRRFRWGFFHGNHHGTSEFSWPLVATFQIQTGPHSYLRWGHFAPTERPTQGGFGIQALTFWTSHIPHSLPWEIVGKLSE